MAHRHKLRKHRKRNWHALNALPSTTEELATINNMKAANIKPAAFVLMQLNRSYAQTRGLALAWSIVSIAAAFVGLILMSLGALMIFKGAPIGLVQALLGIVIEAISALFMAQYKTATQSAETLQDKLTSGLGPQLADEVAEKIGDSKRKDEVQAKIAFALLKRR